MLIAICVVMQSEAAGCENHRKPPRWHQGQPAVSKRVLFCVVRCVVWYCIILVSTNVDRVVCVGGLGRHRRCFGEHMGVL